MPPTIARCWPPGRAAATDDASPSNAHRWSAPSSIAEMRSGNRQPPPRRGRGEIDRLRRQDLVEPSGSYWGDEPIYASTTYCPRRLVSAHSEGPAPISTSVSDHVVEQPRRVGDEHESASPPLRTGRQCRPNWAAMTLPSSSSPPGPPGAAVHTAACAHRRDVRPRALGMPCAGSARRGSGHVGDLLLLACESLSGPAMWRAIVLH